MSSFETEFCYPLAQRAFFAAVAPFYTQALNNEQIDMFILAVAFLFKRKWPLDLISRAQNLKTLVMYVSGEIKDVLILYHPTPQHAKHWSCILQKDEKAGHLFEIPVSRDTFTTILKPWFLKEYNLYNISSHLDIQMPNIIMEDFKGVEDENKFDLFKSEGEERMNSEDNTNDDDGLSCTSEEAIQLIDFRGPESERTMNIEMIFQDPRGKECTKGCFCAFCDAGGLSAGGLEACENDIFVIRGTKEEKKRKMVRIAK